MFRKREEDFIVVYMSDKEAGILKTIGDRKVVGSVQFEPDADTADNSWLAEQLKMLYEQYYARLKEYRK